MNWLITFALSALFFLTALSFSTETGFTQEDREILIRLETTLKVFMEQTNKRFEELRQDINNRFKQVDKRFEQVDKRIYELKQDMNKRLGELRQDMNERFELIDKRFEQIDKRFDQFINFLWMIVGIFTTLTATVIGFAYWDRRTIIRKAREETLDHLEKEGKLKKLVEVLREKAKTDKELETILKKYGLM